MPNIEMFTMWYQPQELQQKIKEKMDEGWSVLYTIAVWQPTYTPPQQPQYFSNAGNSSQYMTRNADGSWYITIPAPPPTPVQAMQGPPPIEVCFFRRDWKQEPCPRCSYPFVNEDAIGRVE